MLIENATQNDSLVQLIPYSGTVNPEHMNRTNCVPIAQGSDPDSSQTLEKIFIDDFRRKSDEFRQTEQIDRLPIEIRLGTVYTYQNRRQEKQYPRTLPFSSLHASTLRSEEHRAKHEKQFLITFNKNKGINDLTRFEYELTCAGFRPVTEPSTTTYRLYLRCQTKRLILELARTATDRRFFSVKRLLKYSTKFTHIDVVRAKDSTKYPETFDDIFDIRTSIGKAVEEEELHINDDECDFLSIKSLEQCVFETQSPLGEPIYQFSRSLLPYFDFFQVKRTNIYEYSCVDSRFFGLKIQIEQQTGYDLNGSSKTTRPCLETKNVIMAKLISYAFTDEEAERIWMVGLWLSDLAQCCTHRDRPDNKTYSRCPGQVKLYQHSVR